MSRTAISGVRVLAVLVLSCAPPAVLLAFTTWPLIAHVWIIGIITVLFSLSELYFRSILSEVNAIFRRGGYSVWQLERLQEEVSPIRASVWRYWITSIILKTATATAVLIANFAGTTKTTAVSIVFVAYSLLLFAGILAFWAKQKYEQLEALADRLTITETAIKEQKKLMADLETGTPHNFAKDESLKGYNRVVSAEPAQFVKKSKRRSKR